MKQKQNTSSQQPIAFEDLRKQILELTEALQRERADAVNLRRRADEERSQAANFHKAMVVRDILPIVDNCERLLEHISADSKVRPWKQGVEQIVKQCQKTLDDLGVERIKTVGQHFNPHLHEAVSMDLSSDLSAEDSAEAEASAKEGDGEHEIITEELQAGYKIGSEVVRPAMVKVRKEKE
ncbi:nucleotide exchange factor GrpE [Candidatus Saccharibacteria bacterium]|nr:nucleotide exchange factor GrpE [Candidatus Saccharibacteria bacterium]